ncbi:efflux RND transporter periplasmic adaptor subunit [Acidovorax sp. CCYZU-2555]|uniref:efflux RND transporter periplasmic adaptor subunit n=1 Tax=Acidovorax sp. CCYZU-2555 TaxID=2835042 RepID=UPI001BCF966A|nr:efflux RND transporter periplasmic adaptor subunit [Acidovorax sp. CCYZU-2555]MBS7779287.1 efflux RND transporter periplasmic adaptor subunit [Acidovorax sp. CCYZU-2555]
MRKKTVFFFTIVLSALAFTTIVYSTAPAPSPAAAAPPATKVALATVQRETLAQVFSGVGELESSRQVQVAAEVGGRVTKIAFESGQSVQAGQLLVQLNDAPEQAERQRLLAQSRNAQTLHARALDLLADNAATQEQVDNAAMERDMALGALRHTEAQIAQKAIRAPFAGVLGIRRVHEGQYLNPADAVVSLVDARTLHANFALDEQASPQLKPGQAVTLRIDAYPERRFSARITAVDPLIARSRTVQLQATLGNADGALRPGMFAQVEVARPDARQALTLPETAVTYTAYGETVFIAQPGEGQALSVKRIAVTTGARQGGRVQIVSGLSAGDKVVTSGQLKLVDGMAVEAVADTLEERT